MKTTLLSCAAAFSLASATPALAEAHMDEPASGPSDEAMEQVMGMMSGLFEAEDLTPEQEARLPAATAVVSTMMPEGFYAEMMSEMMDGMLGPMMGMLSGEGGASLTLGTRLAGADIDMETLSAEEKVELASILDPGFAQRGSVMQDIMGDMMSQAAVIIEPLFRDGLSRAYAVRFDEEQLADIAGFFATPTGEIYATENMKLMADPQVMSASMQAIPAMMSQFGDMEARMTEAMAELPAERSWEELTAAERARMSELTGLSADELEASILPPQSGPEAESLEPLEG